MAEAGGCVLQVGGDAIVRRCVVLPPAADITVTLTRTIDDAQDFDAGYAVRAHTDDEHAEALLAYSTAGELTAAQIIAQHYQDLAEGMLYSKVSNPLGAIVGGYYLLRSRALERMHDWPRNLADLYPRLPDAAIIRIGQLLQSQTPDQSELRSRIHQAVHAGLPSYTDGLRWLYRATDLLLPLERNDEELQAIHRWLRPYADAADWDAILTCFRGNPAQPTVKPYTGLPQNGWAAEGIVPLSGSPQNQGQADHSAPVRKEERSIPLGKYGVLAARVVDRRREGTVDAPHYQIHLRDSQGTDYRAAINVLSYTPPSELLYIADDDFRHPLTALLPPPSSGWTSLPSQPGTASLDFIRGNLFDPAQMRILPPELPGSDNELVALLDHYVQHAIKNQAAVYLFGRRFGPAANEPDRVFGFMPGNGVHDIHMNQGNSGSFRNESGVYQDGGLLIHMPTESRWVAIFLAFLSQTWHTDDITGRSATGGEPVRIFAALVNAVGPASEAESITLFNASETPVDLTGWHLADQQSRLLRLPSEPLAAGATITVPATGAFELGNRGGAITLLDPSGVKVDGVSYTSHQAPTDGGIIAFTAPS